MGKRSFTFNRDNCIIKWGKPDSACFFDWWSIHHFYWQGFLLNFPLFIEDKIFEVCLNINHSINNSSFNRRVFW